MGMHLSLKVNQPTAGVYCTGEIKRIIFYSMCYFNNISYFTLTFCE